MITKTSFLQPLFFGLLIFGFPDSISAEQTLNGFSIEKSLIDSNAIHKGGPPRDGIPALYKPDFIPAAKESDLKKKDRVLGLVINRQARAYPVNILNWHEVVNDEIEGTAFVITYCPLCGTGIAFSAGVDGQPLRFGVSGLLYNSDVLLYDTTTESLWSQIPGQAVTGPFAGTKLEQIPLAHTTWEHWLKQYPNTTVLSRQTGYVRNYERDPYSGYAVSNQLYFPVENQAKGDLHPKEVVLGIAIGDSYKAYPFSILKEYGRKRFEDSLNDTPYTIVWNEEAGAAHVLERSGRILPTVQGYWFAWYAFYPDTEVFAVP